MVGLDLHMIGSKLLYPIGNDQLSSVTAATSNREIINNQGTVTSYQASPKKRKKRKRGNQDPNCKLAGFCHECGNRYASNAKFCHKCGAKKIK